jgi:hypothetical protein
MLRPGSIIVQSGKGAPRTLALLHRMESGCGTKWRIAATQAMRQLSD